ncbi:hypothetical protein QCA50_008125 [Cerrena zonata]|uniref:Uncharacterized protein n=1 Tax=Cerrena zonata TaxID=2478898 RepID=A0AAW0GF39_9APHY
MMSAAILIARSRRRRKTALATRSMTERHIRRRSANRSSGIYPTSVAPFPPPLPSVDYFNSSKIRNENGGIPPTTTSSQPQPQPQPQELPPPPPAWTDQRPLTLEGSSGSQDNIEDLVYRLHMAAMVCIPPPSTDGSLTTAPPPYESIT